MPFDVRAVRLIKSTQKNILLTETKADFIALGHFDLIHVDSLNDSNVGNPLALIQKDRISGQESSFGCSINCIYTLYILRQFDSGEIEEVRQFWITQTTYTVVTRIHCKYPDKNDGRRLTIRLVDYCRAQKMPANRVVCCKTTGSVITMLGPIDGKPNKEDEPSQKEPVQCIFYDSLELGDSVVVMKSKSITAILEVIQCIFQEETVRDTYTYCGIVRQLLQDTQADLESAVNPNAHLSHFTTRFSIREKENAQIYFNNLYSVDNNAVAGPYVTGTADRVVRWSDTSEMWLLKVVQKMVQLSPHAHYCFNDIITRMGTTPVIYPVDETEFSYDKSVPANNMYQSIYDWLLKCQKAEQAPSWIYSMLKLFGTLDSMSSNYVMDDLADLIIPGVNALQSRIQFLLNSCPDFPSTYGDDMLIFINGWVSLTHDVSQLESQLTQHPELIPVRYYIPATLLQFERHFMKKCGDMLRETECLREFVPMLVPSAERDLYTIAPLDPRQEEYSGTSPLVVFIPIQDLYDPWKCSHRMVHEIAHYSGDEARMRPERFAALCECLAWFLARHWNHYLYVSDDNDIDESRQEAAVQILNHSIGENARPNLSGSIEYLKQSKNALIRASYEILCNPRYQEQYLCDIYPEYFYKYGKTYIQIKQEETQILAATLQEKGCIEHIESIAHIVGECYADIAMIVLLKCSFDTYYYCIYHDEFIRLMNSIGEGVFEPPFNEFVIRHIQRMALVVSSIQFCSQAYGLAGWSSKDITEDNRGKRPWATWAGAMAQAICDPGEVAEGYSLPVKAKETLQMQQRLNEWQGASPVVLSMPELIILTEYLMGCVQKLTDNHGEDQELNKILSCLRCEAATDSDTLAWNQLQQYVLSHFVDTKS